MLPRSVCGLHEAWVLIPARGGSVGIPRKNVRMLGGKPLIRHVIDTALEVLPASRVVVVTDDAEIAEAAERGGAVVAFETMATPPEEPLDTKIVRNLPFLRSLGAQVGDPVLTVQPTSPLLKASTIRAAIELFADPHVRSVLTVADDQHLRWRADDAGNIVPAYAARVNRQLLPLEYRETGGVIAARLGDIERSGTRVIEPARVLPLAADEAVDIDTFSDLYAAAHLLSRKRIAIRVDASRTLGMGHAYRMLAFAAEMARHDLTIYLNSTATLGQQLFAAYPYRVELVDDEPDFVSRVAAAQPDLVVFDVLDTTAELVIAVREAAPAGKIISFEDRGTGAEAVDLLVTEFISNPAVPATRKLEGIEYAILSPAFETEVVPGSAPADPVTEVLVLFGGTDPSGLAVRTLRSLARVEFAGRVTVARGLGAAPIDLTGLEPLPYLLDVLDDVKNMPALMARADIAFTSAGRTVIELLSRGVPAVCLAQNEKELTHTHATAQNGVWKLGLGAQVSDLDLDAATRTMLTDTALRFEYAARARAAGSKRRNRRTISEILTRLDFEDFPEI
ncbi:cytidylyltransferase domain-containing protein [Leucobacter sp. HY1910]